jgi:carboxymethylenebutenolidase
MAGTTRTLETPDGPMACFEAVPESGARAAVIVVQEAFGVNAHIEGVATRLAAVGFHAIAPALFHRAGGGTADYGDFAAVIPLFAGVSDDGVLSDIDVVREHLHDAGFADAAIGIVGFCFGGRVTFLVAARRALGAGVGFYGGGIASAGALPFDPLIGESGSLRTPWLGLFGDEDASIPVADVEALREALAAAPVDTEVVRYPGAQHGFHCDARPESYDADAAADGWRRTLAWLDAHLAT